MHGRSERLKAFAIYSSLWAALGAIYLAQNVARRYYLGDPRPWQDSWYLVITFALSAALTPAILQLGRRWPLERSSWPRTAAAHFVFSLLFTFFKGFLATIIYQLFPALYAPLPVMSFATELTMQMVYGAQNGMIAYWLVIAAQTAHQYYVRYQERATLKKVVPSNPAFPSMVPAEQNARGLVQLSLVFSSCNSARISRQKRGSWASSA